MIWPPHYMVRFLWPVRDRINGVTRIPFYYIDTSVLLENTQVVKFMRIDDVIFSFSWLFVQTVSLSL